MSMGASLRTYYRGHNLVGMRQQPVGQSASMRYYHYDHQGTTQALTDSTGAVTDRFASDAWGVQVKRTGTSINRQWYVGNLGYYKELQSPQVYVRARYLAPAYARFLAADPFHIRGSVRDLRVIRLRLLLQQVARRVPSAVTILLGNRFAYASNRPTGYIDPSGMIVVSARDCPNSKGGKCPCITYQLTCWDICTAAENDPEIDGDDVGGTVVCGFGRQCACVWSPDRSPCSERDECAQIHEDEHCGQSSCRDECSSKVIQMFLKDEWPKHRAECEAYRAELRCLLKKLKTASPECKSDVEYMISYVEKLINYWCREALAQQ